MCIAKTLKKIFEKTQIARVKIFSMKHLPVSVFKVCSNKSPRVKIGPATGDIDFPYMCIAKT
jgi:SPX domain protein involved in polyphosphate accumulation